MGKVALALCFFSVTPLWAGGSVGDSSINFDSGTFKSLNVTSITVVEIRFANGQTVTSTGMNPAAISASTNSLYGYISSTASNLASPGTINTSGNPVHWSKLYGVPDPIADGEDATSAGGGDEMGNHVATRTIDAGNFGIANSTGLELGNFLQLTTVLSTIATAIDATVGRPDFNVANTTITQRIDELQADLSTHSLRIDEIQADLSTHTADLDLVWVTMKSTRDAFTNFTATVQVRVDEIQADLSTHSIRVDELQADISTHSIRVDEIQADLSTASIAIINLHTSTAQFTQIWREEGTALSGGDVRAVDCVGAGVACSQSGSSVTVTIAGGSGAAPSFQNASSDTLNMSSFNVVAVSSIQFQNGMWQKGPAGYQLLACSVTWIRASTLSVTFEPRNQLYVVIHSSASFGNSVPAIGFNDDLTGNKYIRRVQDTTASFQILVSSITPFTQASGSTLSKDIILEINNSSGTTKMGYFRGTKDAAAGTAPSTVDGSFSYRCPMSTCTIRTIDYFSVKTLAAQAQDMRDFNYIEVWGSPK